MSKAMAKKIISALLLALIVVAAAITIIRYPRPLELLYIIIISAAGEAVIFGFQHLSPRMKRKGWQFSLIELILLVTGVALLFAIVRISMTM